MRKQQRRRSGWKGEELTKPRGELDTRKPQRLTGRSRGAAMAGEVAAAATGGLVAYLPAVLQGKMRAGGSEC